MKFPHSKKEKKMEKALRYTFVSDLSKTHCFTNPEAYKQKNVGKYCSRIPVTQVKLSPDVLSPENDIYLHAVEVTIKKKNEVLYEIIVRVITNMGHGMNVHIPCYTDEMYEKYIDLKYQVRNDDYVLVTFPYIEIGASICNFELFAKASDFKVYNPNKTYSDDEVEFLFD